MKTLLIACLTFFLFACDNGADAVSGGSASRDLSIVSSDGKRHDFKIELAITRAEQAKGLMNRMEMAENAGMLFFFPQEKETSFWMKNTFIPLDIIFIKKDGMIHHIHSMAIPKDETSILSNGPVMAVLELNGGLTKKLGIQEGDKVHHMFFGNALAQ